MKKRGRRKREKEVQEKRGVNNRESVKEGDIEIKRERDIVKGKEGEWREGDGGYSPDRL